MSTRGIIAREIGPGKFEGRYHHSDSYPSGLGAALYEAYNGHFKQDAHAMLKYLVDDHAAGWSFILTADYTLPPGYVEDHTKLYGKTPDGNTDWSVKIPHGPRCYCHGDRHEEPSELLTEAAHEEWAYAINPDGRWMRVYRPRYDRKAGDYTFVGHDLVATVNLDGPEPNWEHIECGEKLERCHHMAYAHFPELHGTSMSNLSTDEFLGKSAPTRASAYVIRGVTWIPTGCGQRKQRWGKNGPETVWEESVCRQDDKDEKREIVTRVYRDGKSRCAPGVKTIYPPTLKDPTAVFAELRAKSSAVEPKEDTPAHKPEYVLLQFLNGRKFREDEPQAETISA